MEKKDDLHYYGDIIDMPHHQSKTRPHMSMQDRAAQFSPFAALQGHDAAIQETARLTDEKIELDENAKTVINERLQAIAERLALQSGSGARTGGSDASIDGSIAGFEDCGLAVACPVAITYFEPDVLKSGGRYVTSTGSVKKIDDYLHQVIMEDGTVISIEMICGIDM